MKGLTGLYHFSVSKNAAHASSLGSCGCQTIVSQNKPSCP